jgi:hypothetical protein
MSVQLCFSFQKYYLFGEINMNQNIWDFLATKQDHTKLHISYIIFASTKVRVSHTLQATTLDKPAQNSG